MSKLNEVIDKVDLLRRLDKNLDIFGSSTHNYILNPTLTEKQLKEYEKKYTLDIPFEYREFLNKIGNGGCGGFYGLLSLEDNEDIKVHPEKEFKFTDDKSLNLMKIIDSISEKIDINTFEDEEDEIYEEIMSKLLDEATSGIKVLCHEGCGI